MNISDILCTSSLQWAFLEFYPWLILGFLVGIMGTLAVQKIMRVIKWLDNGKGIKEEEK